MRIYTDERAKGDDGPLYQAIVERARDQNIAGATVLRGAVGFGKSSHVHRASVLDLSGNLPLVIELVDGEATLRAFFQSLQGMADIGLVTFHALEVLHYDGSLPLSS